MPPEFLSRQNLSSQTQARAPLLRLPMLVQIAERIEQGQSPFRWIDVYTAQYVADLAGAGVDRNLVIAALVLSQALGQGRICIGRDDLARHRSRQVNAQVDAIWATLCVSPCVHKTNDVATSPADAPLVLASDKLYFTRNWQMQQRLQAFLGRAAERGRTQFAPTEEDCVRMRAAFAHVFPATDPAAGLTNIDYQAVAAAQALLQPFLAISGGPGTGKTTTTARLLLLWLLLRTQRANSELPQVRFLAPTGKAAVRLGSSIRDQLRELSRQHQALITPRLTAALAALPEQAMTMHRYLYENSALSEGFGKRQARFTDAVLGAQQHVQAPVDLLIIDEASMIDLQLMMQLLDITADSTQIILLGDHNQLAPVEPGEVFASIVLPWLEQDYPHALAQGIAALTGFALPVASASDQTFALARLHHTYRFGGPLKAVAETVIAGTEATLLTLLRQPDTQEVVRWHDWNVASQTTLLHRVMSGWQAYFRTLDQTADLPSLASAFESFQILCSTHEGPLGTVALNQMIENRYRSGFSQGRHSGWYHGKAIMVLQNQAELGIVNGDIGFALQSGTDPDDLLIHFPQGSQPALQIPPARIKSWQSAYAISVHKSQGSEYREVAVVLADYAAELLERRLLYTAITRAKERCELYAAEAVLHRVMS